MRTEAVVCLGCGTPWCLLSQDTSPAEVARLTGGPGSSCASSGQRACLGLAGSSWVLGLGLGSLPPVPCPRLRGPELGLWGLTELHSALILSSGYVTLDRVFAMSLGLKSIICVMVLSVQFSHSVVSNSL